jgi:hypothetical protein
MLIPFASDILLRSKGMDNCWLMAGANIQHADCKMCASIANY